MTKQEQLLKSIDPSRTIELIARRVDRAINTFPPGPCQIARYDEFIPHFVRCCRHVEATILDLSGELPEASLDFEWGRYIPVLRRAYGSEGVKTAFELVRTGNEGGLYAVIRKLGEVLAEQYAENEIAARVWSYWNGLSVDEKLAAADEYLSKYGHLLPSELTEGRAGRIRANLPKVLQEHPKMIQRLRRVGR